MAERVERDDHGNQAKNCRIKMAHSDSVETAQVGIVMGSTSDWPTLEHAAVTLEALEIRCETRVVSAHRTPELHAIIAGAGGAAHLPGMLASKTWLPVLGVPVESKALSGMDSLLSIVQMPGGVPVGTLAIGKAGAINAALLAAAMLATTDAALARRLQEWRANQTATVLKISDPSVPPR
jgi:5-(carboxyamino)imidazole ribonucleotide mutase